MNNTLHQSLHKMVVSVLYDEDADEANCTPNQRICGKDVISLTYAIFSKIKETLDAEEQN
jgi:hypothetical protein